MKTISYSLLSFVAFASSVSAATLSQTFESGENTSNWGDDWNSHVVEATFLDLGLGGMSAGAGSSDSQSFWRVFRNNSAGLDVTQPYSLRMFLQIDAFDGTTGGQFEIIDGAFGSANAANLRIQTEEVSPGVFEYLWQARDGGAWVDVGINLDLSTPYLVELNVDPISFTYSASVHRVTINGMILASGSVADIAFDPSVVTNGQNGELRFYVMASAGGTDARIDNINISSIPEPDGAVLTALGFFWLLARRRAVRIARK